MDLVTIIGVLIQPFVVVHSEQYYFNESTGESTYEVPVTIEQTEMALHY